MNQVQKKYVILGSLCALLLTLAIGYAAFSTILNINGTSNINSDWDVQITGIELSSSSGATDNTGSPSYESLSATFNTNLVSPGDYATYKIEITNSGKFDAKLTNITIPENTNQDIVFYVNKDQSNQDITGALAQNDTLYKSGETGNVGYVYVTVLYRDYENQQTATNKTASMTISFDFEQATVGIEGSGDNFPKTVYAYNTDEKTIGTSTITESEYKTNYTELDSYKAGKTWFLKYDIDSSGLIQNAYACMKFTFISDPVCMQGGKDSEGNSYYNANKKILEDLKETFTDNGVSYEWGDGVAGCNSDNFHIGTNTYGYAYSYGFLMNVRCDVGGVGTARCYE